MKKVIIKPQTNEQLVHQAKKQLGLDNVIVSCDADIKKKPSLKLFRSVLKALPKKAHKLFLSECLEIYDTLYQSHLKGAELEKYTGIELYNIVSFLRTQLQFYQPVKVE